LLHIIQFVCYTLSLLFVGIFVYISYYLHIISKTVDKIVDELEPNVDVSFIQANLSDIAHTAITMFGNNILFINAELPRFHSITKENYRNIADELIHYMLTRRSIINKIRFYALACAVILFSGGVLAGPIDKPFDEGGRLSIDKPFGKGGTLSIDKPLDSLPPSIAGKCGTFHSRRDVVEGNMVFNAPSQMYLNDETTVEVVLGSDACPISALLDRLAELRTEVSGPEPRQQGIQSLSIGPIMVAELRGDGLKVSPEGPWQQSLGPNRAASWQWTVKATAIGRHILSLILQAKLTATDAAPLAAPISRPIIVDVRSDQHDDPSLIANSPIQSKPRDGKMKELLEAVTAVIPVVQSSPLWVKAYFSVWLFATAGLLLSVALTYSSGTPALPAKADPINLAAPITPASVEWPMTGDNAIDKAHTALNNLKSKANPTEGELVSALRLIFYKPIFRHIYEETPDKALFTFCRAQLLLQAYVDKFSSPDVRRTLVESTQNLISLQDQLATLYGPTFRRGEQCDMHSDSSRQYTSTLPPRQQDTLQGPAFNRIMATLGALGSRLHSLNLMD
jgi:hypothetical protein